VYNDGIFQNRCFYSLYLDGFRDRGSTTGFYLFERNSRKIGKGAKVVNESPADWDPEFMKGLAIILPNDLPVESPETNSRKDKLHFTGIKNRVKETNVIYQRSEKKGTDHRYVAYIYFRVIFKVSGSVADGSIAHADEANTNYFESTLGELNSLKNSRRKGADTDGRRTGLGSKHGEGSIVTHASLSISDEMGEFKPLCQTIAERLRNRDDLTKRKFLRLVSEYIFDSGSQEPPTTGLANEAHQNRPDRRRKANVSAPDDDPADAHRKPRLH